LLVLDLVGFVQVSDLRHQRIIRVRICQQRGDREQHSRNCESGTPAILQYIQADVAIRVDIRMVDFGDKLELRRLERIICGEVDVQEENSTLVRTALRANNRSLPVV